MLRAQLGIQLRQSARTFGLRGAAMALVLLLFAWIWVGSFGYPVLAAHRLATTLLISALVAGGCFTGWRVAQFPKSRAAEFQLVTPSSDARLVLAQAAGGWLRTALVLLAGAPLAMSMVGAGWISGEQLFALATVPLLAGTLAGLLLAVVAYEPAWLRRLLERLVLVSILIYLLLFGLLGSYFVPRFYAWKADLEQAAAHSPLANLEAWINPFRLMREVGGYASVDFAARTWSVAGFLLALILVCWWRLSIRLRAHYYEENYGTARKRTRGEFLLGLNPLAWWTARRVSKFKGNVNLYLAWATVGLYSAWLLYRAQWPAWLATSQLRLIEAAGGEAMLAAACLHLSLVPTAFLAGLWDSNMQERAGRLELLLTTPLAARQFLTASLKAAWIRGRGYVLAALVMWVAAAAAGKITWNAAIALCLLGTAYAAVSFAAAFAHFAKADTDKAVTSRGVAWAVFAPLATVGLFLAGWGRIAVLTPLGAIYLLGTPTETWLPAHGVTPAMMTGIVLTQFIGCCVLAGVITRRALARFDDEIRASQWNRVLTGQS